MSIQETFLVVRFRQSGTPGGTLLSNMESQIADLNGKIKTLSFRVKKTDEVLKKDDLKASERHRTSLETMVTAVNTLKESIEEKKFVNGEDEESVQEWASGIEEVVNQADECIRELTRQIEQIDRNLKHATALYEHKREIELEREKLKQKQEAVERAHAEELEFEKKKLELKQAQTEPPEITAMASNAVKMPKLVITQFQAQTREPGMTANHIGNSAVIHPVVVVTINGYKFRALLDSGASHSYASATAIDLINASLKSTGLIRAPNVSFRKISVRKTI